MNLIFLNSLEWKTGDNRVRTAQVMISEEKGTWRVAWNDPGEEGKPQVQSWYEGMDWNEMLEIFRLNIKEKLREGYVPLIEGFTEKARPLVSPGGATQLLHYYSETSAHAETLSRLKQWRREQAAQEGRSAFILASNRILQMISAYLPHTLEELAEIPGMGENRIRAYGDSILAITRETERETPFPLEWVKEAVDRDEFELWLVQQHLAKEQSEQEKQLVKRRVLEAIPQTGSLEALQQLLSINRRELVLTLEELDREGYDMNALIDAELSGVNAEEREEVERLFRELGDRYLKPVVNKLYSEEELKEKDLNRVYEWLRLYRLKFRRQAG
ncbi:HRDC domain-containing protein [Paenibacillus aurantius]|uniref:HRDC domain-containing protein n=1 Tax=Paenibacillus aurantius TaxID=2918900 RepID=A0AA96RE76_9BACL|nr:HRDC domain-containing protein [Paenibacillus aurantius]WNQ10211.1 HRDC domain-containing protein [Paenibacillus aurantius]